MSQPEPLKAEDLLPLVQKLSHDEQVRLARLALKSAAARGDAETYRAHPPASEEFVTDEDPLAWDADGWEPDDAPG